MKPKKKHVHGKYILDKNNSHFIHLNNVFSYIIKKYPYISTQLT